MELRPYQREAIDAVEAAEARGVRRPLVVLPTGAGKTVVAADLMKRRGDRALLLAHRDELLDQAAKKVAMVWPGASIGTVKAERDQHGARVVVASVQTLANAGRLARVVDGFKLTRPFTTVIVDEAHHAAAHSYRRVLDALGSFADVGPLTVGITATPERADSVGLSSVFEAIVYQKQIEELIADGYLCDLRAVQVELNVDFSRVKKSHGDYSEDALAEVMLGSNAPEHVVRAYREHAGGRKAIVFAPTVAVAHAMAEAFRAAGYAAEAVDGGMHRDERRAVFGRFSAGETTVLCNCAIATEGYDEPSIGCVVMARPTKSKSLFLQMLGRGTRLYPGKPDCLILDVVGATADHDLMTVSHLFGLPPSALNKRTLTEAKQEARQLAVVGAMPGELVARDVDLFKRAAFRWVGVDGGAWLLRLADGSSLLLNPDGGGAWTAERRFGNRERRTLAEGLTLEYAQGRAEDYARRLAGKLGVQGAGFAAKEAAWHGKPATDRQIALLAQLGAKVDTSLTRREASDLIERLQHRQYQALRAQKVAVAR